MFFDEFSGPRVWAADVLRALATRISPQNTLDAAQPFLREQAAVEAAFPGYQRQRHTWEAERLATRALAFEPADV